MFRVPAAMIAAFLALALTGCSTSAGPADEAQGGNTPANTPVEPMATTRTRPPAPPSTRTSRPDNRHDSLASNGRPQRSSLTIPALGLRSLAVLPYRGSPDDAQGTKIQNGGVAASPHGPRGGVGPGGIGNHIVTAHRTSSTRAFAELPRLRIDDRVHVVAGGTRYTYRISETRTTSFRSARSLARQSAAVPGHPGRRATRAMITLSTCATLEDHARGNYWADEFGNPEHRIEKIGVLVAARPA